jgi:uncharacterized protein (DUF58 family)
MSAKPPKPAAASSVPGEAEALLQRVEWTVLRRLDGLLQGQWRSLFRGAGLDLADLREYQSHDDVRYIDWNVTARMQTPYVREFIEDRESTAWFLLDLSPSVDFGSHSARKRDILSQFVAAMARLLTRHGNRVGALLYGAQVDTLVRAGAGRSHVLQLLHRLQNRPKLQAVQATDLSDLLQSANNSIRRRSMVFVVSDFISKPGWERHLGELSRRHDVLAVRLFDPLEHALPDIGLITVQDAETGERLLVDTQDSAFRARFEALATQREEKLLDSFATSGVDVLELSTTEPLLDNLLRLIALRRQRARARGGAHMPRHAATQLAA